MDIQRVRVPVTEVPFLWELRISGPSAQGPIVSLIGQCILWMFVFCCYHRIKLLIQGRQREARHQELLRDQGSQSTTEKVNIEQMLSTLAAKRDAGGTAQKCLEPVPVSICVDNTCGVNYLFTDQLDLMSAASLLRVPDEEVTCLQASGGPVVQTRLTRLTWTRVLASLNSIQATSAQKRERFLVQLGRWQLIFRPSTDSRGAKKMQLSVNDTNQVPVILYATYSGGILTVEGLHLQQATIQAATKEKCITLKTKYDARPGELEVFTSESGLPSKNLAEVYVLASKNIFVNGDELRVHSLAVRIRNDSPHTVIRCVISFTIIAYFAIKHTLVSMMEILETTHTASVIEWLLPFIIVVSTLILPLRTETAITVTLKKLAVRAYHTLYFTAQYFNSDNDPEILSMNEGVSRAPAQSMLKHGEPSSFQSEMSAPTPLEDLEYSDGEPEESDGKPEESDVKSKDSDRKPKQSDRKPKQSDRKPKKSGGGSKQSDGDPVPNEEDSKEAKSSDVADPMWEWPIYDSFGHSNYSGDHLVRRVVEKDVKAEPVPFKVIYRNMKDLPWAAQGRLSIQSASLLEIIKVLLPEKIDQSAIFKKEVNLDALELFRIYELLRNEQISTAEQESSGASSSGNGEKLLHLNHLLRFLDQEFEQVKSMFEAMTSERKVSGEMLWALFLPGEKVMYMDDLTEEPQCGEVLKTRYTQNRDSGDLFFIIELSKWDYNCRTWTSYSRKVTVPLFKGEREILKLDIIPVKFTSKPEATMNGFKKQGKKFCKLSMLERNCFRNYKGSMMSYIVRDHYLVLVKENADGRVMVDLGSFAKMNPDYPMGSAKPPCEVLRDNKVTKKDITQHDSRMFAPAMVYGFSFRLKKWGCFSVCGFSKIFFNTSAFDDLVMDTDTKEIVENLVRKQLDDGRDEGIVENLLAKPLEDERAVEILGDLVRKQSDDRGRDMEILEDLARKQLRDGRDVETQDRKRVDPIASKGEGSIFLCYGPPGTGKTLTAETLSEKLRCPLWCLSVSELGTTPETLETTLVKVMDIAASWGALLLLDEADVFLEKRTASDLKRNAMTGVFLRLLEYYRGVLFLTTNRDSAFDDAMCSRIAMFLRYERLNGDQRKKIWKKMLKRVGLEVAPDEVAEFAKPEFNGREIRNIVKTAYTLSRSKGTDEKLEVSHVKKSLKVYEASTKVWGRDREKPAPERVPGGCRTIERTLSAGSLD